MRIGVRELIEVRPGSMPWRDNLRLVAPVFVALIGFTVAGELLDGLLVALGAYIVLFGAGQPGRRRLRTFLVVAALMLASITCGVAAAGSLTLTTLGYVGVAAVAVVASIVVDIGPPGPYFFPLMLGGGTLLGAGAGAGLADIVPYIALGNALAIAFAMADLLYDPYGSERRAVAAAAAAVDALDDVCTASSGSSGDGGAIRADRTIDNQLSRAATAVYQAWATVLNGFGEHARDEASARIETDLLDTHARYRQCYLHIVEDALGGEANLDAPAASAGRLAQSAPDAIDDVRSTALGEPSLAYRFKTQLRWPSRTLITLVRVVAAVVLADAITAVIGDRHPFWPVLVIVMVLSYPGDQQRLTLRALQRLLGTLLGIGIFAGTSQIPLGTAGYVAVVCVLLWLCSRWAARNYLVGSVFITVLALSMTVPLSSDQAPLALATNRWQDTMIGAGLALAAIWLLGPWHTIALTNESIRRLARQTIAVLNDLIDRYPMTDPRFVEDRRRLQRTLMDSGTAVEVAGRRTAARAQPYLELERAATRLGYLVLGASWHPNLRTDRDRLVNARDHYRNITSTRLNDPISVAELTSLAAAVSSTMD